MYFLKKSTVADIVKPPMSEDIFYSGINILEHYKEYEIFLTANDLERFFLNGKPSDECKKLKAKLELHKASIKAIHCSASLFMTSSDKNADSSTNYLSLDEVLCGSSRQKESLELLKNTILLAAEFSAKDPVVVVLHAGSINGCSNETHLPPFDGVASDAAALERLVKELAELEIKNPVKIALENITPYVDGNDELPRGGNEGWGRSYFKYIEILKKLNENFKKLNEPKEQDKNLRDKLSFGVCIDFCHLIADYTIMHDKCLGAGNCCDYIKLFMEELNEKTDGKLEIMLFHVSMLGEKYSHGRLFNYNNDNDNKLLETIRAVCAEYPAVPITLEMADGSDIDKACVNFDRMMYTLSAMHKSGIFSKMLDSCQELKGFFENLFQLYAVPWSNMNRIQELLRKVKDYVMENSLQKEAPGGVAAVFGFTYDENTANTALLRLKAYIVYTRFCNLGKYLAEVYEKADFLTDREKDFILSMKYFMFCDDEIGQCVYTGVGYTFNMDFLPKRIKSVFRFYDGIEENDIKPFEPDSKSKHHCFAQMVEGIRNQIIGTRERVDGKETLKLLSCGKNFFPCLMKYYQEPIDAPFTLRIYKDMAVNSVEVNGETLSVPAFLQKYCYMEKKFLQELHFVIDVSVFRNGRDGHKDSKGVGTLAGFIETVGSTKESIVSEKVGSIIDGEIVATKLPKGDGKYEEYTLDINAALGLAKACMLFDKKSNPIKCIHIKDKEGTSIGDVNAPSTLQDIQNILNSVEVSGKETSEAYRSYYKQNNKFGIYLPDKYMSSTIVIDREG